MSLPVHFDALQIVLGLLVLIGLGVYRLGQRSSRVSRPLASLSSSCEQPAHSTGNGKTRAQDRQHGEWEPVTFDYPQVEVCTDELSTIKPIPYRPFRWGEYHVTMGIRKMSWNEWIEIDQNFVAHHKLREYRIRTRGERLVKTNDTQPGIVASGREAARELVYELAEYLSRRYPDIYRVIRKGKNEKGVFGWYGEAQIQTITVVPLQTTYNLEEEDPMTLSALLIQEDLVIMVEGSDGRYYLQAGAIIIPGSWRLSDKIGMPLDEIHVTGHVPQYQSKLHLSMSRFFRRLPLDKPVVRNNYSFQLVQPPRPGALADPETALDPTELAWCRTVHGDEDRDDFERRHSIVPPPGEAAGKIPMDPHEVFLRSERQTLRRLPRTGAVAFIIRVYQTPVVELAKEPGVPGRLASAVRGWSEDVGQYKGIERYKSILPYLDERHREQAEAGLVKDGDRSSSYPF
ncbi:hypothetical protein DAEQUDRAFT_720712 [Daedalea quercina L-15889]|uniref:HRQ family protein n=1 Tax=Daedalea quercina L-15889 TaxID=1314783 RepID=A0A165U834_9APHY|nr:hypothetical protein DAEQUDRAFT_720712 [Daedalea quercina L-15889]